MQRPVQKLTAVVGVEVLHLERHSGFEFLQLGEHGMAAFVPYGPVFRPTAEKLGKREGIDVIACRRVPAVSHGV